MEKLMDHIKPETGASGSSTRSRTPSSSPSPSAHDGLEEQIDVLDLSINEDTPLGILLGIHSKGPASQSSRTLSTPGSDNAAPDLAAKARSNRYDKISKTLHALFPAQRDVDAIIKGTSGGYFVTTLFHNRRDYLAGNCESESDLAIIPHINSHPTVLARRLLQLCICMQQLSPAFNRGELTLKTSLSKGMARIMGTVAALVTSNDELIGTSEGLQSLMLQGIWHSNAGNLRKAWLSNRKALSLAQLMGIDRGNTRAFKPADHVTNPRQLASAPGVWFRIVYCDRFISLLLGLPIGTYDDSFATEEAMLQDDPQERLVKAHTIIAARISERNSNRTAQTYAMTQEIDVQLEAAGRAINQEWWQEPILDRFASPSKMAEMVCAFIHQIHHFDLLVLLHIPYMLRDPAESRYEHSRVTCIRASREVLKRFVNFRTIINSAFSCRHVDYSALIASMTLLLSYLGSRSGSAHQQQLDGVPPSPSNVPVWPPSALSSCASFGPDDDPVCNAHEDRKLIEAVRERMRHVAIMNDDKLSQESADIISRLMPVLEMHDKGYESGVIDCLHLSVPYLGTVSIRANEPGPVGVEATSSGGGGSSGSGSSVAPWQISIPGTGAALGGMVPTEQMDLSDFQHAFMAGNEASGDVAFAQFDPQMMQDVEFPGLMAEADDWTLQGVDTTYWSMLNRGM